MATPVLQFKRGAFSNLPALKAGEPGFTTDKYDFYIGLDNTLSNNKFFGSQRYWTREDATNSAKLNLVDKDGSNYISLESPNTLVGIVTYTLPGTQGAFGSVLREDGTGTLSWSSSNFSFTDTIFTGITTVNGTFLDVNTVSDFSGITTFSNTTQSTDKDTGAVIVEGGVGIEKNLNVGGNLKVDGVSEFVGVATFRGGTINLGDADTDDINVAGEFISNLIPNSDDSFDIGQGQDPKRWRHANFSGIGTFATGAVVDAVQIGISGNSEIDTSAGDLTLDSATGRVVIDDHLNVVGVSTFSSNLVVSTLTNQRVLLAGASSEITDSGNLTFDGTTLTVATDVNTTNLEVSNIKANDGTASITIADTTGVVAISTNLTVAGNLFVTGNSTEVNTESLLVEDKLIEVGLINSAGSLVPPTSDLNLDIGIIFHYFDSAAKQAAVYWDDSATRIAIASSVTESVTNVLSSVTYADVEIGKLFINDLSGNPAGAGSTVLYFDSTQSQVVLENTLIDCGTF